MRLRASLTTFVALLALLAACGGDSGNGDSSATPTPDAKAKPNANKPPSEFDGDRTAKVDELTEAERERARERARAVAKCLRQAGPLVSTESQAPRSRTVRAGEGVVLRLTWEEGSDEGADIYVGTIANTRRVVRALEKEPEIYKRRILLLYDSPPSDEQVQMVERCTDTA
jgi:hypothetical protein